MTDNEQPDFSGLEDSQPSPESSSLESGQKADAQSASSPESKPEAPFHEHPRFKELVQQKNEFQKRVETYERELADLKSKFSNQSKPEAKAAENALISRLKGIDPEFGTWAEQQESAAKELSELKQWKQQMEQTRYIDSAKSVAEKLQGELKVAPELHQMYLAQIPMGTPVDKIGEMYKDINDKVSKLFADKERAALSKYAEAKKSDSKVPGPAKGQPAKPSNPKDKFQYSKDPAEARAQIVANSLRISRSQ